ncbi:MAG: MCE family protein, partial [Mycobacterium sp.]
MLTRLVRIQLIVFTVAAVVGSAVMIVKYLQIPTLLGIGRITVTLDLPAAGGLYRFANVTYRGIQVGKVTELDVHRDGAVATLSLATSPPIPADVQAAVRSVSAVGEQYVDLLPRTAAAPYLHDGSVIDRDNTTVPQPVGPMMDQLSALIGSVPKDKLNQVIDESFQAFNGAAPDLRSLMDSGGRLSADFNDAAAQAGTLIDDAVPFLDAQAHSADSL